MMKLLEWLSNNAELATGLIITGITALCIVCTFLYTVLDRICAHFVELAKVSYEAETHMAVEGFLKELAAQIVSEAAQNIDNDTPEPYRAAGDRLVNQALALIQ